MDEFGKNSHLKSQFIAKTLMPFVTAFIRTWSRGIVDITL